MKPFALILLTLPALCYGQANIFDNLRWSAKGDRAVQYYGVGGMDTVGYLDSSIQHAFTISENFSPEFGASGVVHSALIRNRFRGDTARIYEFPGQKIIKANFDGNQYPDFVCWDAKQGKVTVLYGTAAPAVFDTALVLRGGVNNHFMNLENRIIVADIDSSGTDDLLIDDEFTIPPHGYVASRWLWYKGGATMDTMPFLQVPSDPAEFITICKLRDSIHQFIGRTRGLGGVWPYPDTVKVNLYPIGANFQLVPTDSIYLTIDTARYCCLNYVASVQMIDVDGDGVDDLCLSGYDNKYRPGQPAYTCVFVYEGGDSISPLPSYFFHCPHQTGSFEFGTKIIDLGNLTGHNYHTIAITDPDASDGGTENGAIFLYNIGKALKDSCVAYGAGPQGYMDNFGTNIISLGDSEFAVGADADSIAIGAYDHGGRVFVFHGSSSYGPVVVVDDAVSLPNEFWLSQNYPNPFSNTTTIPFAFQTARNARVVLSVYDMLGREVTRLYDGAAGEAPTHIQFSSAGVPSGAYVARLISAGRTAERIIQIVK